MSEQTDATGTDAPDDSNTDDQKPTETVEFWRDKAREQEKRAKANAAAAKRLDELEEANKSELEKANGRATAAEAAAADATAEALRYRVAIQHGITLEDADLFLTGRDEEALTAQAKRLSERTADKKKQGNKVPSERGNPQGGEDEMRAFTRNLFASAD